MTFKRSIAVIMLIAVSILTVAATKADKRILKSVENIMKRMKTPEKEMNKLERTKLLKSTKFTGYAKKLAADSKAMLRIKHPDKEFNEISKDLDAEMTKLLAAINKKDFKLIEKHWKESKNLCAECHDIYKDL